MTKVGMRFWRRFAETYRHCESGELTEEVRFEKGRPVRSVTRREVVEQ